MEHNHSCTCTQYHLLPSNLQAGCAQCVLCADHRSSKLSMSRANNPSKPLLIGRGPSLKQALPTLLKEISVRLKKLTLSQHLTAEILKFTESQEIVPDDDDGKYVYGPNSRFRDRIAFKRQQKSTNSFQG